MTGRAIVFGKLPAHGDFVGRGLQETERQNLDRGLTTGLARARDLLGEDFEAAHQSAPPWRFILGPGELGQDWSAGALAPSVDSAGRRFLLLVGAGDLPRRAATPSLSGAMEDLIYDAFAGAWRADELAAAIEILGAEAPDDEAVHDAPEQAPGDAPGWWTEGGPAHAPKSFHGALEDLIPVMLRPTSEGAKA